MSIRQNSLSRLSSVNTFNKNSNKNSSINSRHHIFSANAYYSPTKRRKMSNRKGQINFQRLESFSPNMFKSYNKKRISQLSFTSILKQKKTEHKKIFYNPEANSDLKSILKNIKLQFKNKYNNVYYLDNIIYDYNNNNNNQQYLFSDYYAINNILNNKKFHLTLLLKEYKILYNNQEFLIKCYEKKERYIIMKYLLNFVYKYDELCFNAKKEIDDYEKKEELIKEFNYITTNQFLYEHLLESDSFKGIKYLLKRVNLTNKKAQYDYTYLDMTKNKITSEENRYIINALKIVNEFTINRKFLEKRLIKNFPFQKVPNCIPNYYPLGYEINLSLQKYKNSKKYYKIKKPGNETIELINNIEGDHIETDKNKNKNDNNLLYKSKVLFNIDEKITENESSIGDSDNNYFSLKKPKNENNFNKYFNNNNINNNLLPSSLYEISEKENDIDKDKELSNKNENKINKMFYNKNKFSKTINRSTKDPEIIDVEKFIYLFPREKSKRAKLGVGKNLNVKEKEKKYTSLKNEIKLKKNIKEAKIKFKGIPLKIGNDYKNNYLELIKNSSKNHNFRKSKKINFNKNNELQNNTGNAIISNNKNDISLLSSVSNFNINTPKLNQRKINRNFMKSKKLNSILLTPSSNNNISSTIFSDINHLSQNLSLSQFQKNEIEKNKNNLLIIKNNYLNKVNNNFSFEKNLRKNNNIGLYEFKDTQDFIKGSKEFYNKFNIKPKLLLKKLSLYFNNMAKDNKLYNCNNSSKKRIFSSNINNASRNKITDNYTYININSSMTNINVKNISNYIKNQIYRQRQKEGKNITLNKIIKNSDIYSSQLL